MASAWLASCTQQLKVLDMAQWGVPGVLRTPVSSGLLSAAHMLMEKYQQQHSSNHLPFLQRHPVCLAQRLYTDLPTLRSPDCLQRRGFGGAMQASVKQLHDQLATASQQVSLLKGQLACANMRAGAGTWAREQLLAKATQLHSWLTQSEGKLQSQLTAKAQAEEAGRHSSSCWQHSWNPCSCRPG